MQYCRSMLCDAAVRLLVLFISMRAQTTAIVLNDEYRQVLSAMPACATHAAAPHAIACSASAPPDPPSRWVLEGGVTSDEHTYLLSRVLKKF